jgi:hypothetical protein
VEAQFGPTKMGVSTQIKYGEPDLAVTAGVAFSHPLFGLMD